MTDIPVVITDPGSSAVDVDRAFEAAESLVRERLPRAYYRRLEVVAPCDSLRTLEGRLAFTFIQVAPAFPDQQVLEAVVTIDSVRQRADAVVLDVSHASRELKPRSFPGDKAMHELADVAHRAIASRNISPCTAALTQLETGWFVQCRQPPPVDRARPDCRFDIIDGNAIPSAR